MGADGDCGCLEQNGHADSELIQIEDIGRVSVKINDVENEIDVWEVNNKLVAIHEEHQGKPAHEQNAAVAVLVETLGFPRVSHMAAHQFAVAITNRVGTLLKKAGLSTAENAESQDTTASTPSA